MFRCELLATSFRALLFAGALVPALAAADETNRPDFTGLWEMASADLVVKPDDDKDILTDEARARIEHFKRHYDPDIDDQVKFCVPHGMPWMMLSRARYYLIDIFQTPDRITVLLEGNDQHRIIHLGKTSMPETIVPSTVGYSLGRWEGDVLVIETSGLSARNPVGLMQRSEQARVVERWRIEQHPEFGRTLVIDLVIEDPVVYRRPATGRQVLKEAPEGSALNEYGCEKSAWDDYVSTRSESQ